MSDFLTSLARRAIDPTPEITPRVAARFEDGASFSNDLDEIDSEAPAPPHPQLPATASRQQITTAPSLGESNPGQQPEARHSAPVTAAPSNQESRKPTALTIPAPTLPTEKAQLVSPTPPPIRIGEAPNATSEEDTAKFASSPENPGAPSFKPAARANHPDPPISFDSQQATPQIVLSEISAVTQVPALPHPLLADPQPVIGDSELESGIAETVDASNPAPVAITPNLLAAQPADPAPPVTREALLHPAPLEESTGGGHLRSTEPLTAIPNPNKRGEKAPTVKVSIGRVEIRAAEPKPTPAPPMPPAPREKWRPQMSLDDYLDQRNRRSN